MVLQELLARVRDADQQTRGRNRAAIRRLGQHGRTTHDDRTSINFLSPVDSQVYHLLARGQHPRDAEMFAAFGDMVRVVTEASSDDPLSAISDDLDGIEKIVARVEGEYVATLASSTTTERQPNQMKRNLDYAARIAQRTQESYGRRFSPEEVVLRIIDMAKITSAAFAAARRLRARPGLCSGTSPRIRAARQANARAAR